MRLKKILAGALALSLLVTPCVSMAADVENMENASGSITGDGELEDYVKEEAFRMVLPTTAATDVKFTMDPQGLLSETDNSTYPNSTEGWILFGDVKDKNKSKPIITKNKSSYPVQLDVEVAIQNMKTDNVKVKFVENKNKVAGTLEDGTNDTALNMYLAAIPKKEQEKDDGTAAEADSTAIAVDASEKANLSFVLKGAPENYKIKKEADGTYKYDVIDAPDNTKWDQVGFLLTGNVNENADWSEFKAAQEATGDAAEKMSIKVSYTVSKYDGTYADIPADSWVAKDDAYGLIKTSKNVLTTDGTNDIIIEYETEPKAITLVPVQIEGTVKTALPVTKGTQWTAVDGILTIKKDFINSTLITNVKRGTGTYSVTVDGKEYVLTITKPASN